MCCATPDLYVVQSMLVCPTDFGYPVARVRRYTWMVHKRCVIAYIDWPPFAFSQYRHLRHNWHSFFSLASADQISAELSWGQNRPSVSQLFQSDPARDRTTFECALNAREQSWLRQYMDMSINHPLGAVVSLVQNPGVYACDNIGRSHLQTLTRNGYLLYSTFHGRWLTPWESLAAQNFPVFDRMIQFGESSSFSVVRTDSGSRGTDRAPYNGRARGELYSQAGNSMHVGLVGVALMWAILNVTDNAPRDQSTRRLHRTHVFHTLSACSLLLKILLFLSAPSVAHTSQSFVFLQYAPISRSNMSSLRFRLSHQPYVVRDRMCLPPSHPLGLSFLALSVYMYCTRTT